MREENDWRLTNQLAYLKGSTLSWHQYRQYREGWDHDHCSFCCAEFSTLNQPNHPSLSEGYCTSDEYLWVCKSCFDDFKDLFEWRVVEA